MSYSKSILFSEYPPLHVTHIWSLNYDLTEYNVWQIWKVRNAWSCWVVWPALQVWKASCRSEARSCPSKRFHLQWVASNNKVTGRTSGMFCPSVIFSFIPFFVKLFSIVLNCRLCFYNPVAWEWPEWYVSNWKQLTISYGSVSLSLTFWSQAVSLRTTRLKIKKNSAWCWLCVECFVRISRTDSDLCCIRHGLIGFYTHGGTCLQRGTDWFLI